MSDASDLPFLVDGDDLAKQDGQWGGLIGVSANRAAKLQAEFAAITAKGARHLQNDPVPLGHCRAIPCRSTHAMITAQFRSPLHWGGPREVRHQPDLCNKVGQSEKELGALCFSPWINIDDPADLSESWKMM